MKLNKIMEESSILQLRVQFPGVPILPKRSSRKQVLAEQRGGNINRKILSVISFNLFNNAVRAPEEKRKGLSHGPTARTRICSGSAWLIWAHAQTRWLLPRSLYWENSSSKCGPRDINMCSMKKGSVADAFKKC